MARYLLHETLHVIESLKNVCRRKVESLRLMWLGSINWHQPIRGGLFAYETRQNLGCLQDGKACGDVAAESQNTSPISGECRLGSVEHSRSTVPRHRGSPSSLLPMFHEQPAVQSSWKLLHSLWRKFHLFFHFFRLNYTFKNGIAGNSMLTFFYKFLQKSFLWWSFM
jgi:hypothetical protein